MECLAIQSNKQKPRFFRQGVPCDAHGTLLAHVSHKDSGDYIYPFLFQYKLYFLGLCLYVADNTVSISAFPELVCLCSGDWLCLLGRGNYIYVCDLHGLVPRVSPSTSVFPCHYHSTISPNSFTHLPPTLYNIFLPALQFSPVSIIPPLLHTHSSIYHPHCIIFFSQYFSFPLSVSFHLCSMTIYPSPK